MKVVFHAAGGFAGRTLRCSLDTAAMTPADAEALRRLVEEAALRDGTGATPHRQGRDLMTYEIEVEDGDSFTRARFDDASASREAAPLIEFLLGRARG